MPLRKSYKPPGLNTCICQQLLPTSHTARNRKRCHTLNPDQPVGTGNPYQSSSAKDPGASKDRCLPETDSALS